MKTAPKPYVKPTVRTKALCEAYCASGRVAITCGSDSYIAGL